MFCLRIVYVQRCGGNGSVIELVVGFVEELEL